MFLTNTFVSWTAAVSMWSCCRSCSVVYHCATVLWLQLPWPPFDPCGFLLMKPSYLRKYAVSLVRPQC